MKSPSRNRAPTAPPMRLPVESVLEVYMKFHVSGDLPRRALAIGTCNLARHLLARRAMRRATATASRVAWAKKREGETWDGGIGNESAGWGQGVALEVARPRKFM